MVANLYQSQWVWSGWSGAPGYTSFYYATIDEATMNTNLDAERTFFDTVASLMAASCSINPPGNFRVVDAATGELEDVVAPTTPPTGVTARLALLISARKSGSFSVSRKLLRRVRTISLFVAGDKK